MRAPLTLIPLLLLAASTSAEETYSAKSLFFGEDDSVVAVSTTQRNTSVAAVAPPQENTKKPASSVAIVSSKKSAASANIGASYFIRLKNSDGSTRDVLANRKFKSGERFQLGIKVNTPSYIYILNEDPQGKITQIYPQPGRDNFVNAMGVVFLPSQGAFEFDSIPGTEQLLVYVSQIPIRTGMTERVTSMRPDVTFTAADSSAIACERKTIETLALNSGNSEYASKGINYTEEASCANETAKPTSDSYAAKGIAFSDDPTPATGGQVASYVVKAKKSLDTDLFLKIRLAHH